MSDDNNNNDFLNQKKRGRPRKNNNELKTTKTKKKNMNMNMNNSDKQLEEDIIICLPITLANTDNYENNQMNENKQVNDNKQTLNKNMQGKKQTLKIDNKNYSTDSDYDCSDNESYNINDETIIKLKNEINEYKRIINELVPNNSKESKLKKMNVKLVDFNDGHTVITEKTDIACWWCTFEFNNQPCFIPEKICDDTYYVFGCFCSYDCALAYNINMNDYKIWSRCCLIYKLCNQLYNKRPKIAPPKEILQKYGGFMNIDEYRANLKVFDKEYRIIYPPMTSIIPVIEETNKYINSFSVNNDESLKIKRTKPLPGTSGNVMDSFKSLCKMT